MRTVLVILIALISAPLNAQKPHANEKSASEESSGGFDGYTVIQKGDVIGDGSAQANINSFADAEEMTAIAAENAKRKAEAKALEEKLSGSDADLVKAIEESEDPAVKDAIEKGEMNELDKLMGKEKAAEMVARYWAEKKSDKLEKFAKDEKSSPELKKHAAAQLKKQADARKQADSKKQAEAKKPEGPKKQGDAKAHNTPFAIAGEIAKGTANAVKGAVAAAEKLGAASTATSKAATEGVQEAGNRLLSGLRSEAEKQTHASSKNAEGLGKALAREPQPQEGSTEEWTAWQKSAAAVQQGIDKQPGKPGVSSVVEMGNGITRVDTVFTHEGVETKRTVAFSDKTGEYVFTGYNGTNQAIYTKLDADGKVDLSSDDKGKMKAVAMNVEQLPTGKFKITKSQPKTLTGTALALGEDTSLQLAYFGGDEKFILRDNKVVPLQGDGAVRNMATYAEAQDALGRKFTPEDRARIENGKVVIISENERVFNSKVAQLEQKGLFYDKESDTFSRCKGGECGPGSKHYSKEEVEKNFDKILAEQDKYQMPGMSAAGPLLASVGSIAAASKSAAPKLTPKDIAANQVWEYQKQVSRLTGSQIAQKFTPAEQIKALKLTDAKGQPYYTEGPRNKTYFGFKFNQQLYDSQSQEEQDRVDAIRNTVKRDDINRYRMPGDICIYCNMHNAPLY